MAPHINVHIRTTRKAHKKGNFGTAGLGWFAVKDPKYLWVEQTRMRMRPEHLERLFGLSPKLNEMFNSLHRPVPKRLKVRVTDVGYPCTQQEFTEAFLEMMRVVVVIDEINPRVNIPPPEKPVHFANVEQLIWIAAEFEMKDLKKTCLKFLHANDKAFTIPDLIRICEKGQVYEPMALASARLFKPKEEVEFRLVREPEPVIRTRVCLLKSMNMAPRYTSSKHFKKYATDLNDDKAKEFLLNEVVRRPGSTLRRRVMCQDNCRFVDRARRCNVCEHQDAPPAPAINYNARRRALCGNACSLEDGSRRCAVCEHPEPQSIQTLEVQRRELCSSNCSHFDVHGCCTRCDHPRRMDDARRKALCRNVCSVFDEASGRCTTCNHPFGANSILDLDLKRWKLCRNRCANFDVYNCCEVCEYPRQPTAALRKDLCNDRCFRFLKTSDNKTICVICRNELVPQARNLVAPESSSFLATVPLADMTPYHTGIY